MRLLSEVFPLYEVVPVDRARNARLRQVVGRRLRPVRPIRKYEFDDLASGHRYYKGRWPYMSVAGSIAGDLIRRHHLRSVLELGPYLRPLVVGADVMDLRDQPDLQSEGRVILHDAGERPWPIEDARYDLFVALQVFEHLRDRQRDAFMEVRRIARHAIISVPIDWVMDDPRNCHHGITNERALSWFEPVAPTRVVLGNDGPKKRVVFVFEDLQPSVA